MFAFAISEGDRLVLARDRIGIKPLYYGCQKSEDGSETMYFASELKALTPLTGNIKEFPPGTVYDSKSGFHSYYDWIWMSTTAHKPNQFGSAWDNSGK